MGLFAPVCPIQILEAMREAGHDVLGGYHLLLTHHILEEPERFTALFNDFPMSTIFVDNSIVELGDAASDAKVLEACDIIAAAKPMHPDYQTHWIYPVLTDVMGDGPATIKKSTESYKWWEKNAPSYPLMVVLQGNSWETFCASADYFLLGQFPNIHYVGIPRVLVEHLGTRYRAIQYVEAIRPDINVHLLGFSDDVADDVICANHPSVEGIDSAVPLRYSYSGGSGIYTPTSPIPARPAHWFEKGQWDEESHQNLINIRRWVA